MHLQRWTNAQYDMMDIQIPGSNICLKYAELTEHRAIIQTTYTVDVSMNLKLITRFGNPMTSR